MDEGLDIRYYVGVLKHRFLYFLGPFIVIASLGVVVVFLLPAIYRSQATILVESQQIPPELVRSTVNTLADERIAVIQQRVMTRDNLLAIIEKFALFRKARERLSIDELVDLMRDRVAIAPVELGRATTSRRKPDERTAIAFTVGFDYEIPTVAVKVANEFVTLILNEDAQTRTGRAIETTKFLDREAQRLAKALAEIDARMTAFKVQHGDSIPEKVQFQVSALERTEKAISDADRDIRTADEQKRLLEFEFNIKASQSTAIDPGDVSKRLDGLRTDLVQQTAIYSEKHPHVKALRMQIKALEDQIKVIGDKKPTPAEPASDDLSNLNMDARLVAEKIAAVKANREFLVNQRALLMTAAADLRKIIQEAPDVQNKLAVMDRERAALQTSLDDISIKYSKARLGEKLEQDQQAERFEVIEQPTVPELPIKPNRLQLIALSFGLALMAGAGGILGAEVLDRSVRSGGDLVRALNQRPLVAIPYIVTRQDVRRRRKRLVLTIFGFLLTIAIGLAVIHYAYMPLDLLWIKIMRLLQISFNLSAR